MMQIEKFTSAKKLLRVSLLLVLLFAISSLSTVRADDTTVIAAGSNGNPDTSHHPSLVFINRDVGFKLSLVGNQIHSYRTTDSGLSWTDQGNIGQEVYQGGPVVWYDGWTPGDSGSNVYYVIVNAQGYNYDSVLVVNSVNSSGVLTHIKEASLTHHNVDERTRNTVAKNTDGVLHASYMKSPYHDSDENGESNRIKSVKDTTGDLYAAPNAAFTYTNNDTYSTGDDIMIRPLGNGKSIAFIWDISLHQILYSIYTPSATPGNFGTWSARTFLANATDSLAYRSAWAAVTNKTTKEVYFTFNTNANNNSGVLKTYIFNGNTASLGITTRGDIASGNIYELDIAIDNNTGNVYSIYTTDGSPKHFNAVISTNRMASWQNLESTGNFDAYVEDRNYRGISLNQSSSDIIGAALRNDSESGRLYFVKLADLTTPAVCDIPNSISIIRNDFLIDNNVSSTEDLYRSPSSVFVSDKVGYIFYANSAKKLVYRKTTDGGSTWGAASVIPAFGSSADVTAGEVISNVVVWYDRWTPGNVGDNIHILYGRTDEPSSDDIKYVRFKVNVESAVKVNLTDTPGSNNFTESIRYSFTSGTDGTMYAGISGTNFGKVLRCNNSWTSSVPVGIGLFTCDYRENWIQAGTNTPLTTSTGDDVLLRPLKNGKVLALSWKISSHIIEYSIYNPTNNLWSTNAVLSSSATDDTGYKSAWGATVNKVTGDVYLCYNSNVNDTAGVITTAVFSETGLLRHTPAAAASKNLQCDIAYNEHSSEVILSYIQVLGASLSRIVTQKSRDGLQTWSTKKAVSLTNRNYRNFGMNVSSDKKIYAWYLDDTNQDIYGNTILNIDPSRDPIFDNQAVADWLHFN